MQMGQPREGAQLGDYLGPVRRQWFIILAALLLGVAVAFALLSALPKTYQSSESVLVRATSATSESAGTRSVGTVNLDTEAQVAKSLPVASLVKTQLHSPLSTAQLASRVSVSVPPNTTIMRMTYTSGTASDAQKGADAFASAYLDYRSGQAKSQVDSQLKQLDDVGRQTAADIRALNDKLVQIPHGTAAQKNAEQSLKTLQKRLSQINAKKLPLETAQTSAGTVIDSASLPTTPATPNRVLILASSIAVLLALGLALAWWRDRRLGPIRSLRDLGAIPSIDVLGAVSATELTYGSAGGRKGRRRSAVQQEYRQIVHTVEARLTVSESTVLVADVGRGSRAGKIATNLAAAVARTGWSVSLIHVRHEAAEESTDTLNSTLAAGASLPAGITMKSLEQEGLVIDGDIQRAGLASYLARQRTTRSLVLLSTPSTGTSADAQAVAPFVQLTILVVELHRTTRTDLAVALRQLEQVGGGPVAIVAVAPRRRSRGARADRATVATSGLGRSLPRPAVTSSPASERREASGSSAGKALTGRDTRVPAGPGDHAAGQR